MIRFITHRTPDGRYSVINSTMILAFNASRAAALEAVREAYGESISRVEIESSLDNPADPALFRATLASATSAELQSLSDDMAEGFNVTADEITAVNSRQDELSETVDGLRGALDAANRKLALAEAEQRAASIVGGMVEILAINETRLSVDDLRLIAYRAYLDTPEGRKLTALRKGAA